ncbi:MAG: hypothetical protein NUV77_25785 [Thermoguttaceae bacterium]|jgi:uroporphyrinogen decarboxylase|nr:hypothetical protein [Thermoguttaceae bacterium]
MTDPQWTDLLRVLAGQRIEPTPVGLIVDSPWLPGWAGMSMLDYFADESCWLEANLRACRRFPEVWFLPGFWAEYGMCTEPSAFGAKCIFPEREFPFAEKLLDRHAQIQRLKKPNCRSDGLLPLVVKRLERARPKIEAAGHRIRFAVSRGPMNIASYLLGHTEFLEGIKTEPEWTHRLLALVTDFIVDWLRYQAERFDSIDGVLVLDDLVGFVGLADFQSFALPYLTQIFGAVQVSIKALHNDAHGLLTARHLRAMGANLFNFSFEHSLPQIRALAGEGVILLGNIPPRDVLAQGTPDEVRRSAAEALASLPDRRWLILSAGGGTPPGVPSENLDALVAAR